MKPTKSISGLGAKKPHSTNEESGLIDAANRAEAKSEEDRIDEGLRETFPASDPIAVQRPTGAPRQPAT